MKRWYRIYCNLDRYPEGEDKLQERRDRYESVKRNVYVKASSPALALQAVLARNILAALQDGENYQFQVEIEQQEPIVFEAE